MFCSDPNTFLAFYDIDFYYIFFKNPKVGLILTRRISELLIIGDQIKVAVLGVKGNQARLGITAPKDITVHREEIYLMPRTA